MLILQSYLLIAYSLLECIILLYKDTSAVFSKTTFFQLEQPDSRPTQCKWSGGIIVPMSIYYCCVGKTRISRINSRCVVYATMFLIVLAIIIAIGFLMRCCI